jgi:hypothetical protein
MTWLPDHRADHAPDAYCEGCRPPETPTRALAVPATESRSMVGVRPDLIIQPGTNRK